MARVSPRRFHWNKSLCNHHQSNGLLFKMETGINIRDSIVWFFYNILWWIHKVSSHFWDPHLTSGLYPWLSLIHLPLQLNSWPAPGNIAPWSLKRSGRFGYWQMHRYYIYKKLLNKITTLCFYQKIKALLTKENKMHVLIQLQNSNL